MCAVVEVEVVVLSLPLNDFPGFQASLWQRAGVVLKGREPVLAPTSISSPKELIRLLRKVPRHLPKRDQPT